MKRLTLLPVLLALAIPGAASAGTVTITYDITGGEVIADEDPEPIIDGRFKVTLLATGTPSNHQTLSGSGTLQSFSVRAAGITPTYGYGSTRLTARLTNQPAVYGTSSGAFFGLGTLLFTGTSRVHCTGNYCQTYGYQASVTKTFNLRFTVFYDPPFSFASFDPVAGSGALYGTFSLIGGGADLATVFFTGQEIDRVFVPEPSGYSLAAAAIASVGGLALLRARRRLAI